MTARTNQSIVGAAANGRLAVYSSLSFLSSLLIGGFGLPLGLVLCYILIQIVKTDGHSDMVTALTNTHCTNASQSEQEMEGHTVKLCHQGASYVLTGHLSVCAMHDFGLTQGLT